MAFLILYAFGLILIGWLDAKRVHNFDDYVLAGRNRNGTIIGASLLASVVGASATMGVVSMAYKLGLPAFWWLGSGAIGLIIMGVTIAKKLAEYDVYTLADLVEKLIGSFARKVVSVVVVLGWTGIVAAQYVAAAQIVESLTGFSYVQALVLSGLFVTVYCALGGQSSVLKTDFLQVVLMLLGIGLALFFLYYSTGLPEQGFDLNLLNSDFGFSSWAYFMLIVGSGFIVGPDVFSRIFTAKDAAAARKGAIGSGVLLAVVSIAIVMIGVWAKYFIEVPQGEKALLYILNNHLPSWLGFLLSFGLLSAIISSADTCLITASTTFEHDILCNTRVFSARMMTLVLGIIAIGIAWLKADIIGTLLVAYSIFNGGVIPPLFIAIIFSHKRRINIRLAICAIVVGATLGVLSGIMGEDVLAMYGIISSTVISIIAIIAGKKVDDSVVELRS